jgi:hypothetical protein
VGRPSKLSAEQWAQIESRLLSGEGVNALASEFGVSKAAVSKRFSKQSEQVKNSAKNLAAAQAQLEKAHRDIAILPLTQQAQAISLADKLRNISNSLAHAAENGAATAHRLSAIANTQAQKINDTDPMESQEQLQAISALTKIANDAASLGLGLVNANKGATPEAQDKPQSRVNMRKLSAAALEEILAARDGH